MDFTLKSALDYSLAELADILNKSFTGYIINIEIDAPQVAQMVRREAVDLSLSWVLLKDNDIVGVALIGRRGWTSRLAAMGLAVNWRGQGIGRQLMTELIDQAQARGEHTMILEVIEQNEPALRLYRNAGFRQLRRLVGYKGKQLKGIADRNLHEVDLLEMARQVIRHGPPDLPWQISGETLAQSSLPLRGYQLGPAYAAISAPEQPRLFLRGLVIPEQTQPHVWGPRLLQALIARYPDKSWGVPVLYPEELVHGLFEGLGFQRERLTQLQMILDLKSQ